MRSAIPPLQLPEGAVIDLVQSGSGMSGSPYNGCYINVDSNPIMLTFTPGGSVDQVFSTAHRNTT